MIKQISVSFFIQFIFKNLWDHGLPWTCHMTWHSSRQALLKSCGSWSAVEDALQQLGLGQLEPFLQQNLGRHNAPTSPVVSVVLNILNADLWRQRLGQVDIC